MISGLNRSMMSHEILPDEISNRKIDFFLGSNVFFSTFDLSGQ